MPIFEYRCSDGHLTEKIRSFKFRDATVACWLCTQPAMRVEVSAPHVEPDGVYSYEPNLGSRDAFDRKYEEGKARRRR